MTGTWVTGYFCPILGDVICLIMWLAPFAEIMEARKTKELGPLNVIPFFVIFFNCCGWLMYACIIRDYFVFFSNITGVVLSLFYCSTSLQLLAIAGQKMQSTLELVEKIFVFTSLFWCALILVTTIILQHDPAKSQLMVGVTVCLCAIMFYSAPLSSMYSVITKRDSSSLLFNSIVMNTVNALMWTLYGLLSTGNPILWVPNAIGIALGVMQFCLYIVFPRTEANALKKKKAEEDLEIKNLGALQQSTTHEDLEMGKMLPLSQIDIDDMSITAGEMTAGDITVHRPLDNLSQSNTGTKTDIPSQ